MVVRGGGVKDDAGVYGCCTAVDLVEAGEGERKLTSDRDTGDDDDGREEDAKCWIVSRRAVGLDGLSRSRALMLSDSIV